MSACGFGELREIWPIRPESSLIAHWNRGSPFPLLGCHASPRTEHWRSSSDCEARDASISDLDCDWRVHSSFKTRFEAAAVALAQCPDPFLEV